MATGFSYKILTVPGEVAVVGIGSATNPSVVFGNPNDLGGMNDGFYATTTPTIGISINGSSVATWGAAGLLTGSVSTSGSIASSSSILSSSATAGIGYATGSGSTVTQGTSKSTGVTINAVNGAITLNNAALGAGAVVKFTVTNSAVDADDMVAIAHSSAGTAGIYHVDVQSITAGSFAVAVHNYSGSSASEAIVLSYMVFKGVAA